MMLTINPKVVPFIWLVIALYWLWDRTRIVPINGNNGFPLFGSFNNDGEQCIVSFYVAHRFVLFFSKHIFVVPLQTNNVHCQRTKTKISNFVLMGEESKHRWQWDEEKCGSTRNREQTTRSKKKCFMLPFTQKRRCSKVAGENMRNWKWRKVSSTPRRKKKKKKLSDCEEQFNAIATRP